MKTTVITKPINIIMFFQLLLFLNFHSFSQSMGDFFKYQGVKVIASLAHPSNTYLGGEYQVFDNYVWMKINYKECTTELKLNRRGNYFTGITVLRDTDWWPPFSAFDLIKEFVVELIHEEARKSTLNQFERFFLTSINDMDAKQLSCLTLTIGWLDY